MGLTFTRRWRRAPCVAINDKVPFANVRLLNTGWQLLAKGAVIISSVGLLTSNQEPIQSVLKVYAALAVNYDLDLTNNQRLPWSSARAHSPGHNPAGDGAASCGYDA